MSAAGRVTEAPARRMSCVAWRRSHIKGTPHREILLFQVDWVRPGTTSRRIPYGEPNPLLTRSVEGNVKLLGPERHVFFQIDVLVFGLDAIAPHQGGKVVRER